MCRSVSKRCALNTLSSTDPEKHQTRQQTLKSIKSVRFFSASVLRFSLRVSARPVRGSETCRADARFRCAPPRRAQKPRAHVHRPTSRGARRSRGRRAAIGARGERRVGAAHAPETRRSRLHRRGRRRAPGDRGRARARRRGDARRRVVPEFVRERRRDLGFSPAPPRRSSGRRRRGRRRRDSLRWRQRPSPSKSRCRARGSGTKKSQTRRRRRRRRLLPHLPRFDTARRGGIFLVLVLLKRERRGRSDRRFRRRTRRTRTRRTAFPRRFPPRVRVHGGVHALFVRRFVRREEMFDRSDVRDLPRANGESAKSARPARRGATTREPGKSRAAGPERRVRGGHQARATSATTRRRRRRRRSDAFSCRRRAGGRVRLGKQEPVRVGAVGTLQAANRDRVGTSRERLSVFFTPLSARFLFFFTRRVFWVFYFFPAAHA
jgi:hypothetical protein